MCEGSEIMTENTKPMNWHKFLIYVGLWAGALNNLWGAGQFFSGSVYGEMQNSFYQTFPALQWLNIAWAVVMIALAAYQIYTRFQLAGFKAGAPGKLLSIYVMNGASDVLYVVLFAVITGISLTQPDNAETILARLAGRLIAVAIMFFINKVYYGKRAELFVN